MINTDEYYMLYALDLAARALFTTTPNPRVGCVIVKNDKIIGEGWHQIPGGPHAEVFAIQQAGEEAKDATFYVTLEPCAHFGATPPCVDAVIAAGPKRVVIAMQDPNPLVAGQGIARLQTAGIEIEIGICEKNAINLNHGFISRMTRHRPWVRVKAGMSLDGRTAMANGESQWITGQAARDDVQYGRAKSCAILSGIGTVLSDDPLLNVRLPDIKRQPLRVIVDSTLRISPQAKLLQENGNVLIATCSQDVNRKNALEKKGVLVAVLPEDENNKVDLLALMQLLAEQYKINDVWVEAGATLMGALATAELVDEYILYIAPKFLGDNGRGLLHLPQLQHLNDAINLTITEVKMIGEDLRITVG